MLKFRIPLLATLITLAACIGYPDISFRADGDTARVTGVIDDETLASLQKVHAIHPGIDTLVLQNIPGSVDDEASLSSLSEYIRSRGYTTVVPSYGMVASGGTDLMLMGQERIIESGACIGVHTWAVGGLFGPELGSELPRDHPSHQLYLSFYEEMGIPEDFYWFTLEAAGPNEVYWMSPEEISRFGLSTRPVYDVLKETPQERRQRCDMRL